MNHSNKARKVKRGEIYYYDFGENSGSIQSGERPVLVVQCEEGNQASLTTVVAAITTAIKKQYLPSHVLLGENFGLKKPSMVLLEQLKTVNLMDLTEYVGIVDDPSIEKQINNGLKKALGLWHYTPVPKEKVRCLCARCLEDYKSNPNYIIRRLNPYAREKERCDKCQGMGYEYLVYNRQSPQR